MCLLLLAACSNETPKEQPPITQTTDTNKVNTLADYFTTPITYNADSIRMHKKIRVILHNSPISYFLYKGQPMGFQYELAARFAKDNNLEIEVVLAHDIQHAMQLLGEGKGDVIATGLTINPERKEYVNFTDLVYSTYQCLIQHKPEKWRVMHPATLESQMLRDVLDLDGDTVHVKYASTYKARLNNLADEIGGDITVVEREDSLLTLDLMAEVASGKIKYTVADNNLADLGTIYYDNLDVETAVSFTQQIAWAVRKNDPELMDMLNVWIEESKRNGIRNILYKKYFSESRSVKNRMDSPYNFIKEGELSPYDDLIKQYADTIDWDWRLLAAQIYKESQFDPKAKSWVGAKGLMQLMPRTAASYGVSKPQDPERGIYGGTRHILWLTDLFEDKIEDPVERQKFILGAYNVGQGHVFDAQRLAVKHGKDPQNWDDVAEMLLKKSSPKYYKDPVVKHGYCRGIEVVTYVERIYEVYGLYKDLMS